ncbi:hypothetical protein L6250_02975 [Candidatus Parcubacteria bacterium]|nr:hypothetical protein [Candidatus Parcubacteria bacterium]
MDILLPILISSLGCVLWFWSRGGKIVTGGLEADKEEQAMRAPMASPLLWFVGFALNALGLYRAYLIGWIFVLITFFAGAFVGYFIFRFVIRRFI